MRQRLARLPLHPAFQSDLGRIFVSADVRASSTEKTDETHNPSPRSRIAVYTAVTNDYDQLLQPIVEDRRCDYIAFVDRPHSAGSIWQQRPLPRTSLDPVRLAKIPKILPHRVLPEYRYSVWVDANVLLMGHIGDLVDQLQDESIGVFSHPEGRPDVLEEVTVCIDRRKDDPKILSAQAHHYKTNGFDLHSKVFDCGILIREHYKWPAMEIMEEWWRQVSTWSRRDQVSFPYALWCLGGSVHQFPGHSRSNEYFRRIPHKTK
jgi:hypothetical protein